MDLGLKIRHNTETRRITLNNCTYETLVQKIREIFNLQQFAINYEDEEGDMITIKTEEELIECARLSNGKVISMRITSGENRECDLGNLFNANKRCKRKLNGIIEFVRRRKKLLLGIFLFFFLRKILWLMFFPGLFLFVFYIFAKLFYKESLGLWKSLEAGVTEIIQNQRISNFDFNNVVRWFKQVFGVHIHHRQHIRENNNVNNQPNYVPNQQPNQPNVQNQPFQQYQQYQPYVPNQQLNQPNEQYQPNNNLPKQPSMFEDKLSELDLMGFNNRERNLLLLQRFNGDVSLVITEILSN
eukprot:TRINITY_DN932_c0_g1_i1.p1 TRINITY_DN932_c0_g1~~TRINITY_DN932_c0_g1_i1.p1  ORF type:complete len:299 (+),score=81.07 TRINITY_DN932_c0_g1_i1:59-955(+)